MLTSEGCRQRRTRLLKAIESRGRMPEWLIVSDPRHLMYLANFPVEPFAWSSPPPGLLRIDRTGSCTLVVDNLAVRNAATIWVDRLEVVPWYNHADSPGDRRRAVIESFLAQIPEPIPDCVGFELRSVPAELLRQLLSRVGDEAIVPIDDAVLEVRRCKLPDEIELIRRCIAAGEAGQMRSWEVVRPGITELEVYSEIARACTRAAGQGVVVYGDFCSGPRTWLERGGPATQRRLEAGDLMILDFSVVIGGYRGDFTNTIAVDGLPTDAQRRLFDRCVAGMAAGERALAPGAHARDVFEKVSGAIADGDPTLRLRGHAGHGIGLAHPEPPIIVPRSADRLEAGDVVTLEPGTYVAGVGGMRFENNYRIVPGGFERLTNHRVSLTLP